MEIPESFKKDGNILPYVALFEEGDKIQLFNPS